MPGALNRTSSKGQSKQPDGVPADQFNQSVGWRWFAGWAVVGGTLVFALLTALSIGIFVAPFAIAALILVVRRARLWPESLGVLAGIGAVAVAVAALNWRPEPGSGAPDAVSWLVAGLVLIAGGITLYGVASCRRKSAQG